MIYPDQFKVMKKRTDIKTPPSTSPSKSTANVTESNQKKTSEEIDMLWWRLPGMMFCHDTMPTTKKKVAYFLFPGRWTRQIGVCVRSIDAPTAFNRQLVE